MRPLFCALVLAGCLSPRPDAGPTRPTGPEVAAPVTRVVELPSTAEARAYTLCPLVIRRASVQMEATARGPELTFHVPEPQREEVRRQVTQAGEVLASTLPLRWRPDDDEVFRALPPLRPVVEYVPSGARLTLIPDDPAFLEPVTVGIAEQSRHLQLGGCVILEAAPPDRT